MINCVSASHCVVPPARSNCTGTQLVYGVRGDHTIYFISKLVSILANIITSIVSVITHFVNRFMQCRQNTVVALMGSIQHCIFNIITGSTAVSENTYSDGIIGAEKNERYNHHDNLAQVRKSEKTLQYLDQRNMIEASMCDNCNNVSYNFYQTFGKSDHITSTHMIYGRDYYYNQNFRNYSTDDDFFKVICAPISLSLMPTYFL